MDKKTTRALAQGLPLITQFGLSLAVPPVAGVVSACGNCFCIMLRRAEEDERAYREGDY